MGANGTNRIEQRGLGPAFMPNNHTNIDQSVTHLLDRLALVCVIVANLICLIHRLCVWYFRSRRWCHLCHLAKSVLATGALIAPLAAVGTQSGHLWPKFGCIYRHWVHMHRAKWSMAK